MYHGSTGVVYKPLYGAGKSTNDYGKGFYCTESIELAREWASTGFDIQGIVNKYELDLNGLKILNLSKSEYGILNWISVLIKNRDFSTNNPLSIKAKQFLIENFYVDINAYDIVIGYRADDSYFKFAKAFLNNAISKEALGEAMRLGDLGEQIVLISERAFKQIKFISSEEVNTYDYYSKRFRREQNAKEDFNKASTIDGEFIRDIIRRYGNAR